MLPYAGLLAVDGLIAPQALVQTPRAESRVAPDRSARPDAKSQFHMENKLRRKEANSTFDIAICWNLEPSA